MKILRKAISIALLTAGMAGAVGIAHAGQGRDDRDNARAERAQRREQFRSHDADAGRQPQGGQGVDAGRHGRMTPDERRALRRQINEAGQDIYAPRR